jgi:hypothetical protein
MNGEWDCDGDTRFGEPHDLVDDYPELLVGRLTVRDTVNVQNWVNKMLQYEMNGSNDLTQFTRSTWIYDEAFVPHPATRAAFPVYIVPSDFYSVIAPFVRNAFGVSDIRATSGIYNINCHASPLNFLSRTINGHYRVWADNPGLETENDAGLEVCDLAGCHYIVYDAPGCYAAAFDPFLPHDGWVPSDITMADAHTNLYPTTLGIAYLGNTRWGSNISCYLQDAFWTLFFGGGVGSPQAGASSLGLAEGLSKVAFPHYYYRHTHNLFGSPELEPWIMEPGSMLAEVPSWILVNAPVQFPVRVADGNNVGIPNVRVCLHKTDDIYQMGWTDAQGEVTFVVQAQSLGTILVTCTHPRGGVTPGQQYLPCQDVCEVVLGDGPQAEESGLPKVLGFTALTPSPVFGDFTVRYGVPVKGRVKLMFCDVQGRVEKVIRDGELSPGYYRETFRKDGRSVPAGVHFLVLAQNGKRITRKLVLMD